MSRAHCIRVVKVAVDMLCRATWDVELYSNTPAKIADPAEVPVAVMILGR